MMSQGTPLPTVLASALAAERIEAVPHCGALTPRIYGEFARELDALLHTAGVSDLGWQTKIRMTGTDRIRWANGMLSNTVQSLPEGQGNYSFLLSSQGRILGDGRVYRRKDDLLFDTSLDQLPTLLKHLDHYIIMDDVELADVTGEWTALSLAGPGAPQVLANLGISLSAPPTGNTDNARTSAVSVGEIPCTLVELPPIAVPRYELWFHPTQIEAMWETLQAAGALPCGLMATEALRTLEAIPLYGVDINERDLPQETAQTRALNFNKGCYLGQEIVERIRSRGKVNRQLRQFSLQGIPPTALPTDILSAGQSVGRITTAATLPGAGLTALGFVRLEPVERGAELTYDGGSATVLPTPPATTRLT